MINAVLPTTLTPSIPLAFNAQPTQQQLINNLAQQQLLAQQIQAAQTQVNTNNILNAAMHNSNTAQLALPAPQTQPALQNQQPQQNAAQITNPHQNSWLSQPFQTASTTPLRTLAQTHTNTTIPTKRNIVQTQITTQNTRQFKQS